MKKSKILFKAKRKDNGEWIEGNLVEQGKEIYIIENIPMPKDCRCVIYFGKDAIIPVISKTVGQYVNRKDKKGIKIFTGDIVRKMVSNYGGVEMYEEQVVTNTCPMCAIQCPYIVRNGVDQIENIGNIHDKKKCKK